MVARGDAEDRRASPSSSWASTLAVPRTSWASLAHAYASSFVPRAPPSTATDDGPPSAERVPEQTRPRRRWRHPSCVGTRSSPWRASGAVSRSGEADRLEGEAALVAQPAPVDRVDVDALVAQHVVLARLDGDPAADRAGRAGALGLLQVPRPGLEPVGLGGERADRADLHRVAAEVGRERVVGEGLDLCRVAAAGEVDQRVAGDVRWRTGCSGRRGCSARGRGRRAR